MNITFTGPNDVVLARFCRLCFPCRVSHIYIIYILSLYLKLVSQNKRNPPTSRDDSLVVGSGVTNGRQPPMSRCDLLGVVRAGVERGKLPTSHHDSLVVGSCVASGREPPTSRRDSLGVVWASIDRGNQLETTNESSRLVGGWIRCRE